MAKPEMAGTVSRGSRSLGFWALKPDQGEVGLQLHYRWLGYAAWRTPLNHFLLTVIMVREVRRLGVPLLRREASEGGRDEGERGGRV